MTGAAITLRNVTKRFASHQALDAVTLDVAARGSVVILGPSGCGKTTLLRLIAGLEVPDSGEIWLGDVQVASAGRSLLPPYRRQIGFVFQDLALWPHLTVTGNLEFVLDALKVSRAQRNRRIDDALKLVRIDGYAVSNSGLRWRVRWWEVRVCCSWTSRSQVWTRNFALPCGPSWPGSSERSS